MSRFRTGWSPMVRLRAIPLFAELGRSTTPITRYDKHHEAQRVKSV